MKQWLSIFSAVFAAGLVLLFFFNRAADARSVREREIAAWTAEADREVAEMQRSEAAAISSGEYRVLDAYYHAARMHLDSAPAGANKRRLEAAAESAQRELAAHIEVKSAHAAR